MKVKVQVVEGNVAVRSLDSSGKQIGEVARYPAGTDSGDHEIPKGGKVEVVDVNDLDKKPLATPVSNPGTIIK